MDYVGTVTTANEVVSAEAPNHVAADPAGAFKVFPNAGLQDLLIGFPTAAVLFVVGLAMLPAERF